MEKERVAEQFLYYVQEIEEKREQQKLEKKKKKEEKQKQNQKKKKEESLFPIYSKKELKRAEELEREEQRKRDLELQESIFLLAFFFVEPEVQEIVQEEVMQTPERVTEEKPENPETKSYLDIFFVLFCLILTVSISLCWL